MTVRRVAFCGASGTGKTSLAAFVRDAYGLPMTPWGSREVSRLMGFASPYDVDDAGKRESFQVSLLAAKSAWEATQDNFVSDRTHVDNLVYTEIHAPHVVHHVDKSKTEFTKQAEAHMKRYTHIFFCPMGSFFDLAQDAIRVKETDYHMKFEALVLRRLPAMVREDCVVTLVTARSLEARIDSVRRVLGPR